MKKKNPDYATDDPNNHIICKIATTVILFIQIPGDKAVTYMLGSLTSFEYAWNFI